MRLTELLQLTNDLNPQTTIYLTAQGHPQPLAKLKISQSECLLYSGNKPMTKKKLNNLIQHLHDHELPVYFLNNQIKIPIYGIQILPESNSIILM